jgi:hypothetical protein
MSKDKWIHRKGKQDIEGRIFRREYLLGGRGNK